MNFSLELFLIIILALWLIVVTVVFYRRLILYERIIHRGKTRSLSEILAGFDKQIDDITVDLNQLSALVEKLLSREKTHLQKIGLVRFNPFADTGGKQSFVLALLDGEDNGLLITALYSRQGTRWYTKRVKKGKGVDIELTDEEREAIKKAENEADER